MADSFVQLNNDGPGKKIDTRTESTNGDHRQVMVIGDPSTNANVANVTAAGAVQVDGSGTTQPVSAVSLPLPAGAATAANQTTASSTLSSILANTPANGQATMANSSPVVIASNQSSVPVTVGNFPATQPVSGTVTTVQPTGTNLHTVVDSGTITLSGTSSVSGTVTANQGTANTLANGWPVELSDGTNLLGVTAHPVRTDPTGTTTQPISGTVTANAGTGTFAISAASLPLPTGASTAANQTSVIGPTAAGTAATNSLLSGGQFNTVLPTLTNTQQAAIQLDASARAIIAPLTSISTVTVVQPTAANLNATVTGTVTTTPPSNASTNITQFGGVNISTGTGASGTGIPRVTVANDSNILATQSGTWTVQPGNTANTTPWLMTINQGGNSATVDSSGELAVADADLELAQGSTTSGQLGPLIQGAVTTAAPTYVTTQTSPLSLTTAGALRTDASATTQPVSGTVTANQGTANAAPWNENVAQFGGNAVVTGTGASGVGIPRVTISNDSSLAANQSVNTNQIAGAAIVTAASGIQKVGVSGATGVTLDAAQNAAAPANELVVGGVYQTTIPAITAGNASQLQVDSTGALAVNMEGRKASYSAGILALAVAATPTDIFTIFGSGTKTIRVLRIVISGTQTTAGEVSFQVVKRSAANTGGTSTNPAAVPHDSNNAAATAVVTAYTANPTAVGAQVGSVLATDKIFAPPAAATTAGTIDVIEWGSGIPEQGIVLRGTTQGLCVNLNAAATTITSANIWVDWTEE